MPTPALLFAVFAAAAIALGIVGWRMERRRREELAALAERLGLSFDPSEDRDHDDEYAQFGIFRRGSSRTAHNTLYGTIDLLGHRCALRAGDFRYEVKNGKHRTTNRFSYLIVHPPWPTPALVIRPEGVLDRIAGALGFDDIDFESEEFSRAFHVTSDDKRFAYDVLHPRMMEFLLEARPPLIDIEGGALCLSDGQRRWQPADFERRLGFVREFGELWPRHLVRELEA